MELRDVAARRVALQQGDPSPIFGDIATGVSTSVLCNNLSRTPLFRHRPKHSDFLLLTVPARDGAKAQRADAPHAQTFLRRMPSLFAAGQQLPQKDVFTPNSTELKSFLQKFQEFHLLKLFKVAMGNRLRVDDAIQLFPDMGLPTARKRFKEIAEQDSGSFWTPLDKYKDASFEPEELIEPEDVCLYESMLAARLRLEAIGLTLFEPDLKIAHIKDGISWMDKNLKARKQALASATLKPMREAQMQVIEARAKGLHCARFLHERRILAPWSLTQNFVKRNNSTFLRLAGTGDPSGNGWGFSFLRQVRCCCCCCCCCCWCSVCCCCRCCRRCPLHKLHN